MTNDNYRNCLKEVLDVIEKYGGNMFYEQTNVYGNHISVELKFTVDKDLKQLSKNLPYVNESTDEIPLEKEECDNPACGCTMKLNEVEVKGNVCVMCEKFKLPHHFAPDHVNVCTSCWSKVKKK
jgi:hypothetical protein